MPANSSTEPQCATGMKPTEKIGTGEKGNAGSEIQEIKCYVAIKNERAIAADPKP